MSWVEGDKSWQEVLRNLDSERFRLRCSYSGAWFRGVTKSTYKLLPSLFRATNREESKWETSEKKERAELDNLLKKKTKEFANRKSSMLDFRSVLYNKREKTDFHDMLRDFDQLTQARQMFEKSRNDLFELENQRKNLGLLRRSEAEAFHDYYFRSGENYSSSWEVLAEMQHTGVPTRLLDWTETPLNAFYFAVEPYIAALAMYWYKAERQKTSDEYPFISKAELENYLHSEINSCNRYDKRSAQLSELISRMQNTPRVWVLNAIECSSRETGRYRVWDVTQNPHLDYYKSFIAYKDWEFDGPLPIYSPWRRPRIAAQRGMFTVHGRNDTPLEDIFPVNKEKVVGYVDLVDDTPIVAAKHILTFCGLDHYAMFRDLDNLAARINVQFFPS